MADKREIRVVTASEPDVNGLIERGSEVDSLLKTLGKEDKGIKTKIIEVAVPSFEDGDTSIRIVGATKTVLVTAVSKTELNVGSEKYPDVCRAVRDGKLGGVVLVDKEMCIPYDQIAKAADVLTAAGVQFNVVETLRLVSDVKSCLSDFVKPEEMEARKALVDALKTDVTYRIKYE